MEFLPKKSVQDYIDDKQKPNNITIRKWARQLVSAVHSCHMRAKIIQRDIKPENLFLKENGDLVLGDFGCS
jgi:serine/threonine protein kinase